MPNVYEELLADDTIVQYGTEDRYNYYYTCIPEEKEKSYTCVEGQFDIYYSDKFFAESATWKVIRVPKILPSIFHTSYLKHKCEK